MSTYGYDTYGSYGSYGTAAGAIVGGVLIFFLVVALISLAVSICTIIGQWKVLKKAGKNGWEAIVPVYGQIVICQVVGVNPWWLLVVFIGGFVLNIIPVIGSLASMAISVYFMVLLNVSVARSFGKNDGFAAGLIFLPPVFWLMLGSKDVKYCGQRPMKDYVMDFVNEKILNKNTQSTNMNQNMNNNGFQNGMNNASSSQATVRFCTACGYKVANGERFCPSCGKEM